MNIQDRSSNFPLSNSAQASVHSDNYTTSVSNLLGGIMPNSSSTGNIFQTGSITSQPARQNSLGATSSIFSASEGWGRSVSERRPLGSFNDQPSSSNFDGLPGIEDIGMLLGNFSQSSRGSESNVNVTGSSSTTDDKTYAGVLRHSLQQQDRNN